MVVILCESIKDAEMVFHQFIDTVEKYVCNYPLLKIKFKDLCIEVPEFKSRFLFTDARLMERIDPTGQNDYYDFIDQYDFMEVISYLFFIDDYPDWHLLEESYYV